VFRPNETLTGTHSRVQQALPRATRSP
jgi:hypothetical protein